MLILWLGLLIVSTSIGILSHRLPSPAGETQALLTLLHWVQYTATALLILYFARPALLQWMVTCIAVGAATVSLLGVVQLVDQNVLAVGVTETLGLRFRTAPGYIRPESVFSEPAYFGFYALVGALCCIGEASLLRGKFRMVVRFLCVVGIVIPMALGPIAVSMLMIPLTALHLGWRPFISLGLAFGAGLLVVSLTPLGPNLHARVASVSDMNDSSAQVRAALNKSSLKILSEHPLTGVGLGQSRYILPEQVHVPGVEDRLTSQGGNSYLAAAIEEGIPLSVLLFGPIVISAVRTSQNDLASLGALLLGASSLSWSTVSGAGLPFFWLLYGVALGSFAIEKDSKTGASGGAQPEHARDQVGRA